MDPGEAEKTCELAASGFKHFPPSLPMSILIAAAAPPSPGLGRLDTERGVGAGIWGHVTTGPGDIWGPWVNRTLLWLGQGPPGCTEEGAFSPSRLSAICQGTGQPVIRITF